MVDTEVEQVRLRDETLVGVRTIRPDDADALQRLLGRMSDTSRYFRFFRHQRAFSDEQVRHLSSATGGDRLALVAIAPERPDEVIAVARYARVPNTTHAEFAIAVEDAYQGRGLGRALMQRLIEAARAQGIQYLVGLVLPENVRMLKFMRTLGVPCQDHWDWEEHVRRIEFDLRPDAQPSATP